mmetsp:Transcript_46064/g.144509  ORF Transcript_46064/g.144509 Transcript_46064/m.144509 type:complete len:97 (-) Transcript_46064:363-653(-)
MSRLYPPALADFDALRTMKKRSFVCQLIGCDETSSELTGARPLPLTVSAASVFSVLAIIMISFVLVLIVLMYRKRRQSKKMILLRQRIHRFDHDDL